MLRAKKALSGIAWRWRCWRAVGMARFMTLAALQERPARRVLVVCYGNIYRSPFVAQCLRKACGDLLEIRSMGFHPRTGRPSPDRHVAAALAYGVDLTLHRSAMVGADDIHWADLFVLMDRHNWQGLMQLGARTDRCVWLGALDSGPVEIPDPYRLQDSAAEAVVRRLATCSGRLAVRLCETTQHAEDPGINVPPSAAATRAG